MEVQNPQETTGGTGLRYGLLSGLVSVIFSFGLFATDMDQSPLRWLGLAIVTVAMVLAHLYFKRQHGGFMSYSQGLSIGTVMSGVSGALSTGFSYVYMTFIDPEYMNRLMQVTRAKMEDRGGMSDEQIDQAMGMAQRFSSGSWMLLFGILGSLLFGFLIALLVSAFTKHTRPDFE